MLTNQEALLERGGRAESRRLRDEEPGFAPCRMALPSPAVTGSLRVVPGGHPDSGALPGSQLIAQPRWSPARGFWEVVETWRLLLTSLEL